MSLNESNAHLNLNSLEQTMLSNYAFTIDEEWVQTLVNFGYPREYIL